MSSRNEHYLETIGRLQKEKDELKEVIDVMANNRRFLDHQLSLLTREVRFIHKNIGYKQSSAISNAWMNSDERKRVVDTFNTSNNSNTEAHTEDLSPSGYECIDIPNHKRDELLRED